MSNHPFDSISAEEIKNSSIIIKREKLNSEWIFNTITLQEPEKAFFLSSKSTQSIHRKSFIILIERHTGKVYEAIVNLTEDSLESFIEVPSGNQPVLTPEDCFDAERICKDDAGVKRRCAEVGYPDMKFVVGDPWSVGYLDDRPEFRGMRLVQLFMYGKNGVNDNHYAHPFNFVVLVDLTSSRVVVIDELPLGEAGSKKIVKIPQKPGNYNHELLGSDFFRKDLTQIQIFSPDGPSFKVNGNLIQWQKFNIRISFNYREGLVLHNVEYQDGERLRPLFYRASICEMAVPYGQPKSPFHRKCAFDVSDYGLGFCTNSLQLGCDCLGTIKYFDAVLNNHAGEPYIIKNAICLHEEDDGVLFKHTEYRNGDATVVRSRRLVLSFIVTVVNYEYAIYWNFHLDGTIKFEIKATGELSTNLTSASSSADLKHGILVSPNVEAQIHQHIFVARIDPMIDGLKNTVSIVDILPLPKNTQENPYSQGFYANETILQTTKEGMVNTCQEKFRSWIISNKESINEITGKPVTWKLIPTNGCRLLPSSESYIFHKAEFAQYSLWVTQYNEKEKFPSGFYVLNKGKSDNGIGNWMKEEKNIENEDIVLWHVFGMTHFPRVEDYPIMPVEVSGFTLKPNNFFMQNPALDVPSSSIKCNSSNY